ncbi:hypothetical protein FisN_9Lh394 [Fistulifera solaris]|uniref:Uncharacterized protein n=1 Tax=Fistulifera solaris TaxID=1519565 RepID=A0A1Z5KMA2_FISSO|nr:hypothetical protein FisN_9Lh394 [Fistulifera solaris]|eukprot:GAX27068.1 hypothetical protein FisN_9Lh394 [Fistulifera solaris]
MIPEDLLQRRDSRKFMTIEVRHSDTLASLRDEDNTFISSTSTITTRSGLTGLDPLQNVNVAPTNRRVRRQESLTASTIVEKSPIETYELPQPVPGEKTEMILPLGGRTVLQLEDEDITIRMLKTMHAQLERELQEKKERNERKKRMKQMVKEEKERERRVSSTKGKHRSFGDAERYTREQEKRDLKMIQQKLKEQKQIDMKIALQIEREKKSREQRPVRDDRRHVVPAHELIINSKMPSLDLKYSQHPSGDKLHHRSCHSERNTHRFLSDANQSPVNRAAPRPPARHLSPDEIEPLVLISQQNAQMSMASESARAATREYLPSEEDTALGTFADSYSSLDPKPFCSAVDSIKLARGECISSEEDDTFVDTFVSESGSFLLEREIWAKPAQKEATRRASKRPSPSTSDQLSPKSTDQQLAISNRVASFEDSFSLLSLESDQR